MGTHRRSSRRRRLAKGYRPGAAALGAFAIVVAPWALRNVAEFGAALPSAGGHTLWITDYNEQFSIGSEPSVGNYLGWGIGPIVASKLVSWG